MIVVLDMDQFMDNHVAEGLVRSDHQSPVERERARGGAGPPAGLLVPDRDLSRGQAEPGRLDRDLGWKGAPATNVDDFGGNRKAASVHGLRLEWLTVGSERAIDRPSNTGTAVGLEVIA